MTEVYGKVRVRADVPPLVRRHFYVSIDRVVVHYFEHTYWQAELYILFNGSMAEFKATNHILMGLSSTVCQKFESSTVI